MNNESLKQMQEAAYDRLQLRPSSASDPARRAELLADEREQRLLTIINEAVYFGTLKAHLTLAVIGVAAWFAVMQVLLS